MIGPLDGLRIIDLTQLLPGPFATMMMADHGAEVIKVEPLTGDYIRWMPPQLSDDISAYYAAVNRNKKSLAVNLKTDEGRVIMEKLLETADVLVEGFRPGVMAKLGLDYPTVAPQFPRLVYCSITGYGQDGPYRLRGGHDINYLALAGVLSTGGPADGLPQPPGVQIADLGGGALMAVSAISFALLARERTGKGDYIDLSMMEGAMSWLSIHWAAAHSGWPMERGKTSLTGGFPCYRVYPTGDGKYLSVGALEPKFWQALCQVIERPDLVDGQFATDSQGEKVVETLTEIFTSRSRDEWMELLGQVDCCVEPVLEWNEVTNHPQVQARGSVTREDIPGYGTFPHLSSPLRFHNHEQGKIDPPKNLGQDNRDILSELGYTINEIEALKLSGTLKQ